MRTTPSIIIDRSELFREGLAQLLTSRFCRVIAAVSDVTDIPQAAQDETSLLVIISSNDKTAASIGDLRNAYPTARILVLAAECEAADMCEAMSAGANGYLSKSVSVQVLLKSLDLLLDDVPIAPVGILGALSMNFASVAALKGADDVSTYHASNGTPATHQKTEPSVQPVHHNTQVAHHHNLSDQELRVTLLLARGCTNKLIAIKLDITEATVKAHVKAILRKIRVRNRTQAALWAIENKLVSPSSYDLGTSSHIPNRSSTLAPMEVLG